MTDPIPQADAAKVLGDLGEVPRVTQTVDAKPAASPAGGSALVDAQGVAFNPELHARDRTGNPMKRVDGGWQLKRGNGARKNSGKPASGGVSFLAPPRAKPAGESAAQSAHSGATATPPPTGDDDQVHDAEVEPMPTLGEEDYESTARGLQRGAFALARLRFGDAWREDDAERKEWVDCLRRVWHHYQLPRLGAIAELVMLLWVTIAKRSADAATREGWQKVKVWLGIGAPPSEGEPPKAEENKAA